SSGCSSVRERTPTLAFDATVGCSLNVEAREENEEKHDRNRIEHGAREHQVFAGAVLARQEAQTYRQWEEVLGVEKDQGSQEVVPHPREGEERHGRERRLREGQDPPPVGRENAGAVYVGCFIKLFGYAREELCEQEDHARADQVRDNDRPVG